MLPKAKITKIAFDAYLCVFEHILLSAEDLKCVPQHYPCGGGATQEEDEYNPWTETLKFGERPTAKWPTADDVMFTAQHPTPKPL